MFNYSSLCPFLAYCYAAAIEVLIMQFPYGICDFQYIIENNLLYVDRTHLIPKVERAGLQIIFLRPRRFGKSLWLSTLENYYDIAKADKFEQLFGHLAIGKQPTKLHNKYATACYHHRKQCHCIISIFS
ncbi:MAG: AAA family ATPase [Mariprofundales bacterium]